jgi:hypothetical protein
MPWNYRVLVFEDAVEQELTHAIAEVYYEDDECKKPHSKIVRMPISTEGIEGLQWALANSLG